MKDKDWLGLTRKLPLLVRLREHKGTAYLNETEAAAEIERLRAIVDRLPKTADGVTVLPGDIMFARLDGKIEPITVQYPLHIGTYDGAYSTVEAMIAAEAAGEGE